MILGIESIREIARRARPHLAAVGVFLLASVAYFSPVLQGKMLRQGDMQAYYGSVKELDDLRERTGEYALWTDRLFGGMPTFLINNPNHANLMVEVHDLVNLGHLRPACHLFVYMLGFYLAALMFGVAPWLSVVGALAYAFSTYSLVIIDAGHLTKAMALGYMPPVVASVWYAFNRRRALGSIALGISLSLLILANHLQITYYTLLLVIALGVAELVASIRGRALASFGKTALCLAGAAALAAGSNATTLWTVLDYAPYSMRGAPTLPADGQEPGKGLPIDYITAWSYGKAETLNMLVPNLTGGSSHMAAGDRTETYRTIEQGYGRQAANQYATTLSTYWGDQPFTSGPVYVGASVVMLFALALALLRDRRKWWMLAATALAVILAWGHNLMPVTCFFVDYVPGYNKFRTVSMILVVAQLTVPLLAVLAADALLRDRLTYAQVRRPLAAATASVAGAILLATLLVPGLSDLTSPADAGWPADVQQALVRDRAAMARADGLRSLLFALVTSGLVWGAARGKLGRRAATAALGAVFLADLVPVDLRYSTNDNWVDKRSYMRSVFQPTAANREILKDKDHYRVLNLAANTFNDASTSYFHNSVGGYHGAKMQRYQELIRERITPEMSRLSDVLRSAKSYGQIDSALAQTPVLNMLNTRYLIVSPDHAPLRNPHAMGAGWVVGAAQWAADARAEMDMLATADLGAVAVMGADQRAAVDLPAQPADTAEGPAGSVRIESYSANRLEYSVEARGKALAVFGEMYYPRGWTATVDGQPAPILRANYLLRAVEVPAGRHTVKFEFRPASFFAGNVISSACSSALLALLAGYAAISLRNRRRQAAQSPAA